MNIIYILMAAPFVPNLLCFVWLVSPGSRSLGRRPLLFLGTLLPILGGGLALPFFADPDGRLLALLPIGLAYGLDFVLLRWGLAERVPRAQHLFLGCVVLGTTALAWFVWGWTSQCAFSVCL